MRGGQKKTNPKAGQKYQNTKNIDLIIFLAIREGEVPELSTGGGNSANLTCAVFVLQLRAAKVTATRPSAALVRLKDSRLREYTVPQLGAPLFQPPVRIFTKPAAYGGSFVPSIAIYTFTSTKPLTKKPEGISQLLCLLLFSGSQRRTPIARRSQSIFLSALEVSRCTDLAVVCYGLKQPFILENWQDPVLFCCCFKPQSK
jgi:hypothetical protein